MGWTEYQAKHYKNGKIDVRAELHDTFRSTEKQEIIADAIVGRTYYAAVRNSAECEYEPNSVWCLVVKFSTSENLWFAYKDMDESVGPYEHTCPNRILDLLTPTDSEWANEWREKCREYNREKKSPNNFKNLPDGTIVEWTLPFDTKYHREGETLKLRKGKQNPWRRRSPYVWHIVGEMLYMKPAMVNGYKVIE